MRSNITFMSGELTVRNPQITGPVHLMLCGDFHTAPDDERGIPYQNFSARMAQYGPKDCQVIQNAVSSAAEQGRDAVLMLGDMLNFPSEKGVELLSGIMQNAGVPCFFIAGNHDWHYEGTPGTDIEMRKQWIESRLKPLYQGRNPMQYTVNLNGLKMIMIDNSCYEILPEQLEFLRHELKENVPALLCMHIPLYIPGRCHVEDFGCGHPQWGAASDIRWKIERRQIWREHHTDITFEFHRTVFSSENLVGIVAGHTHTESLDFYCGKIQYVVPYRRAVSISLLPLH